MCHRWWRKGRPCPRDASNRLRSGPTIFCAVRPDTGDDVTLVMPSVNAQGHGPVSRTLRRYPGPGCARRHDVRRRRLARRARPHRPRQRHLGAVARLTSPELNPVERVWLYWYANASYRSASSTTPRPSCRRASLPSMDRPHRRTADRLQDIAKPPFLKRSCASASLRGWLGRAFWRENPIRRRTRVMLEGW